VRQRVEANAEEPGHCGTQVDAELCGARFVRGITGDVAPAAQCAGVRLRGAIEPGGGDAGDAADG